jgi:hypothetical protein
LLRVSGFGALRRPSWTNEEKLGPGLVGNQAPDNMENKTMKLQHIPLSQLKVSPVNVRKQAGDELGELIASISSLGVIQPLLVRPNCDTARSV